MSKAESKKRICIVCAGMPATSLETSFLSRELGLGVNLLTGMSIADRSEFYPYSVMIFVIATRQYDHFAMQRFIKSWSKKKFLVIRERDEDAEQIIQRASVRYVDTGDIYNDFEVITRKFLQDFVFNEKAEKLNRGVDSRILSQRLEDVALSIEAMRLNSVTHIVEEIRKIRDDLSALPRRDSTDVDLISTNAARGKVKEVLKVISAIFDAIEDSKLAAMIVAGSVSAIVGYVGWSAVACSALCLASWHGKDAFMEALKKLPTGSKK